MRKLLAILVLLSALPAFASIGAATAWDVQATGLDTNGGAFDSGVGSPGTDESMGAGTAITITLASSTTGTGSPVFSSTTHGPGNFVHIASGAGCTTGWFEILSQSGGTATFDHSMGSTSNVCVGTIGGSLLTISQAITNAIASNSIYVKKGTYTLTSGLSPSVAMSFLGYQTTHSDLNSASWATWQANAPLVTSATNSVNLFTLAETTYTFRNFLMTHTAATRADCIKAAGAAANLTVINVSLDGCSTGLDGNNRFDPLILLNSEIKNWTGNAILLHNLGGTPSVYIGWSWIHDAASGTSSAIAIENVTSDIDHTIVSGSGGAGVEYINNVGGSSHKMSNSTIANNHGNNITLTSVSSLTLNSNIIYGSVAAWGINGSIDPARYFATNNAWGGNSSGNAGGTGPSTGLNPVTLSASPFNSSSDFGLNSTAGGGAACKAAGFPGVFAGGSSTGYPDIGAVQSQASAGSTSGPYGSVN